jgi:hypothetical protein
MNLAIAASRKKIGMGLLVLLSAVSLSYAQRQESRGGEGPRESAPPPRAAVQRPPAVVDRTNHGSIRHVDTHVVQRPVEAPRSTEPPRGVEAPRSIEPPRGGIDQHQHFIGHHDVDVDVGGQRFWHGFVFGARIHGLRPGYFQLSVNGLPYFCDDGIYYQQVGDDYQEVYPPVGADVQELPDGAIEVDAGNGVYYYAGGAFYVQQDGGYVIVPAPIGVIVPELPPGAVQTSVGGWLAYQFNGTYYQPQFVDGVTQYVTISPN